MKTYQIVLIVLGGIVLAYVLWVLITTHLDNLRREKRREERLDRMRSIKAQKAKENLKSAFNQTLEAYKNLTPEELDKVHGHVKDVIERFLPPKPKRPKKELDV